MDEREDDSAATRSQGGDRPELGLAGRWPTRVVFALPVALGAELHEPVY